MPNIKKQLPLTYAPEAAGDRQPMSPRIAALQKPPGVWRTLVIAQPF